MYTEESIEVFLKEQGRLYDEPVAETGRCRSISGGLHGSCCGKH